MPRFYVGQKVLIGGAITTKDRGREGTIISIKPNTIAGQRVSVADKYTVRFEQGDEADFYDIQLIGAAEGE
jgi:hypothetical protein